MTRTTPYTFVLFAVVLAQALAISWLTTPLFMRWAHRWGFLDQPGHRKIHSAPKPLLGGAAIFLAFNAVVLGNLALLAFAHWLPDLGGPLGGLFHEVRQHSVGATTRVWPLAGFLLGGLVVFVLGLIDDKYGMSPWIKLAGQSVAALILIASGVRLEFTRGLLLPGDTTQLVITSIATYCWVVLLTNSFNLLDNMDGLCAGVAVITLGMFAAVAQTVGEQHFMVLAMCALIGAILGFLYYNFHPSKIFMGDAGSMFIGYSVSSLTILSTYYVPERSLTRLDWVIPLVVMAVPLFDTISVVCIRIRNGAPLYQGDKNHFSHRLVALGFSTRNAVLMIYLVTACTGLVAVTMPHLPFSYGMVMLVQVILTFAIISLLENVPRNAK